MREKKSKDNRVSNAFLPLCNNDTVVAKGSHLVNNQNLGGGGRGGGGGYQSSGPYVPLCHTHHDH